MLNSRNRKLAAESLESRQLLHGGGLGSFGAAGVDEQVAAVFERHDATADGILDAADELSDRVTDRLAIADRDADGGVSMDELTVFHESSRVSRLLGVGDSDRHGCHRGGSGDATERVTAAIEVVDDDGEGDIDQSEVSEELWEQLASADTDGNASLSSEELVTLVANLDAERQAAFIADKVDSFFSRYDADEDGSIAASEVSERRWSSLSEADTNADEAVSRDEATIYVTAQVEAGGPAGGLFGGGHRGGGHHERGGRGR